jgi:cytochrome c biogenesis protein CcmG/thiol:disulfide interchange protein DsbE
MRWLKSGLPLLIFLGLSVMLWRGLDLNPRDLPSVLINQTLPPFNLPGFDKSNLTEADLRGQVSLVNVFASWCESCRVEHAMLTLIREQGTVKLYGINYKDAPNDARQWLTTYGNPYEKIGVDRDGRMAIEWGVYGTPETFVIDKQGRLRYRHAGVMDEAIWQQTVMPLINELQHETA